MLTKEYGIQYVECNLTDNCQATCGKIHRARVAARTLNDTEAVSNKISAFFVYHIPTNNNLGIHGEVLRPVGFPLSADLLPLVSPFFVLAGQKKAIQKSFYSTEVPVELTPPVRHFAPLPLHSNFPIKNSRHNYIHNEVKI